MDLSLLRDVLRSELTKLRSIRSTYWSTLIAIVLGIGLSAAIAAAIGHDFTHSAPGDREPLDHVGDALNGLAFTQLAFGVIAILAITGEYSSGTIRTTMAAVPQRRYVVIAKGIWLALLAGVVSIAIAFGAFFAGQAVFAHYDLNVSIHYPGALRVIFGAGIYMAGIALFALGLGLIIRHTAGTITTLFGLFFILPGVLQFLPDSWQRNFVRYLPPEAGGAISRTIKDPSFLAPWAGCAVFLVWCLLLLGIGTYLLRTRDI
jgi:hypothetical protein